MTPFALTDHRAVFSSFLIKLSKSRAPRWRFNTSLLSNVNFMKTLSNVFEFFISVNQYSVDDPRIIWEAVKGCIWNTTISFASQLNKTKKLKIEMLESEIAALQQEMATKTTLEKIKNVRKNLNN